MGIFSFLFRRKIVPTQDRFDALDYERAIEIAGTVKNIRQGIATTRDSDGNEVKVFYPESVVEDAARAASLAPNLSTSLDEIERIFTSAEERISSGVHTT